MNTLISYGWNQYYQDYYNNLGKTDFEIGRVISIKGFKHILITENGELESELSGKMLYGNDQEALPKVGDWVFFIKYDTLGYIIEVLPRINELYRKTPGARSDRQVLATNIDYALVVQGLDRDFNLMRLDRYLVQLSICNIKPVVVLNKVDLIDSIDEYQHKVNKLGRNCPVYFCSTYNQTGIAELKNTVLQSGKTYVLIGSSGVGKSSLLNSFMEISMRSTGAVSHSTGKGMHVTTTRDLFQLPNGSLIVDTPGMKEFGIASDDEHGTVGLFPLIDNFANSCRYSDCQHIEEEGCAVIEAYKSGELEPEAYESYLKLIKEQKHFEIKVEDQKRIGKRFGKMVREVREYRKKYKY